MSRPEDLLPPEVHYSDIESRKYTTSSRIISIQASMTQRALSLLSLSQPSYILDLGCGSGLSGEILSNASSEEYSDEHGPHVWVGMDISASMLGVALEREVEGDLLLSDIGQGVPFRPGTFDAAISISAIQWLCSSPSSHPSDTPELRLRRFFGTLYASLRRGGKAVCQFYPKNAQQRNMISEAAVKAGFGAGILEDGAGTKNEKLYLVLQVGGGEIGDITGAVKDLENVDVKDERRMRTENKRGGRDDRGKKGTKAWIMRKKEQAESKGKVVKSSSKYTGRKRRIAF